MIIGDRLRALREEKKLSQGDIEKRTGLLRCYISRVENGHTVPAIETLEKLERAQVFPAFRWPVLYGHSLRGKYNNAATLYASRCRPGRVSFLRGVREDGHL